MAERGSEYAAGVAELRVPVSVVLAETSVPLDDILELRAGALLELQRDPDAPLDLRVEGTRIGSGRAVAVGDRLGFRLDHVPGPPPAARGATRS